MELRGQVVSGGRLAAFFTQLDWVMEQCAEKLGFEPFPGTLNVEIVAEDLAVVDALKGEKGIELIPADENFCAAKVLPITIRGQMGAVIIPAKDVNIHEKKIVEIMAGKSLRNALDLEDGDLVTVVYDNRAFD